MFPAHAVPCRAGHAGSRQGSISVLLRPIQPARPAKQTQAKGSPRGIKFHRRPRTTSHDLWNSEAVGRHGHGHEPTIPNIPGEIPGSWSWSALTSQNGHRIALFIS